jgi:hypothetical protein
MSVIARRTVTIAAAAAVATLGGVVAATPSQAESGGGGSSPPFEGKSNLRDIGFGTDLTAEGEEVKLAPPGAPHQTMEFQNAEKDGLVVIKTDDNRCLANHSENLRAQGCLDKQDKDRKEQNWKLEDAGGGNCKLSNQGLYVRVEEDGQKIRLDKGGEFASVFTLGQGGGQGQPSSGDTVNHTSKVRLTDAYNQMELGANGTHVRSGGDPAFLKEFNIEDAAGGRKIKLADQNYCLERKEGNITTSECRRADDSSAGTQRFLFEEVAGTGDQVGYRIKNGNEWLRNHPDGAIAWTSDQGQASVFVLREGGQIKKLAPSVFQGG